LSNDVRIQAGKLRDRFTVEKPGDIQNAYGENVGGWKVSRHAWGQLVSLGGRQLQLAQANTITSTATHQVIMRYADDIDVANTRLTLPKRDGTKRKFRVNSVDDVDNRHAKLVLTVTEVVG
jgi:SPP1 family predicted phage head-tail adaptor